jgi:hypothetical protein
MPDIWNLLLLTITSHSLDSAIKNLEKDTLVRYAELSHFYFPQTGGNPPNDPDNSKQASLHILTTSYQYRNANINVQNAWNLENGKPYINVGVIDYGIDFKRKEFSDTMDSANQKILIGKLSQTKIIGVDYFSLSNNIEGITLWAGYHGTAAGGIIGAVRDNKFGIAGIAGGDAYVNQTWPNPNYLNLKKATSGVSLYSFRIFANRLQNHNTYHQTDTVTTEQSIMTAVYDAVISTNSNSFLTQKPGYGMHVVSNSWGNPDGTSITMIEAINFAYRNKVTMVFARGNDGDDGLLDPAAYKHDDWIISVGACDTDGNFKHTQGLFDGHIYSSNVTDFNEHDDSLLIPTGYPTSYGRKMDFIAPGAKSLVRTVRDSFDKDTSFFNSSCAAPHVAGIVALMMSHYNHEHPNSDNLAPEDVQNILKRSAKDVTIAPCTTGYDKYSGFGIPDAYKAIQQIDTPFYKIIHQSVDNADTSFKFTLLSSADTVYLPDYYMGLTGVHNAGKYIVDLYKVEKEVSYSAPSNYDIIDEWARGSSSTLISRADSNIIVKDSLTARKYLMKDFTYARISKRSAGKFTLQGFIYRLRKDSSGNPISRPDWIPSDTMPNYHTIFSYSLLAKQRHTTAIEPEKKKKLEANTYPNPTSNEIYLSYHVPELSLVSLNLVDINGRILDDIVNKKQTGGDYIVQYPAEKLAPGVYFFKLTVKDQIVSQKFIKSN